MPGPCWLGLGSGSGLGVGLELGLGVGLELGLGFELCRGRQHLPIVELATQLEMLAVEVSE